MINVTINLYELFSVETASTEYFNTKGTFSHFIEM